MATILVSIICIAMIVVGGMTLSQGILTSADNTALSVEEISLREGELSRTQLEVLDVSYLSWSDLLRITVRNDGQTRLALFEKWDVIAHYSDNTGSYSSKWLRYTEDTLSDNEWQKAGIGLNGPIEYFEPDILNPGEEMVILAKLNPMPGISGAGDVTVAAPNGINDSAPFSYPGHTLLEPTTANITLGGSRFYRMQEAVTPTGTGINFRADFAQDETGSKILANEGQPSRESRHLFSLTGIDEIPAGTWTVYYRSYVSGAGTFPRADGDVRLCIDIIVRRADGTIRTTLASAVAAAYIDASESGTWVVKSGTYSFGGYTVVDETDYLEIVCYGATDLGPEDGPGYLQVRIDDGTLDGADRTRIES